MERAQRRALFVVVTGLATIVSVITMGAMAGKEVPPHTMPNGAGLHSTMLWFELAYTPQEIFDNLGPINSAQGPSRRVQLDITNRYDYAFMVCYSLFNAALVYLVTHLNVYRLKSLIKLRVFLVLGLLLCVAMLVGDIVENVQLLELTKVQSVADLEATNLVSNLVYWTRVKWGAIFFVCLMLSAGYASYFRRIPTLLLPAVYAVAGVSGLIAISLADTRIVMEMLSTRAIVVAWTASLLHAGLVVVRGPVGFPLPDHLHVRHASVTEADVKA